MLGLATVLLLLLPEVVMPRPAELSAAAVDEVELERLSTRLGPARLLAMFEGAVQRRQPKLAQATLRGMGMMGAAHPDLGVQLLPPLCETLRRLSLAQRLDDKLQGLASDALYRTTTALSRRAACSLARLPQEADAADCEPAVTEAAERLYSLGADAALPALLREGALEGLAQLPPPAWKRLVPRLVRLAAESPPEGEGAVSGAAGGVENAARPGAAAATGARRRPGRAALVALSALVPSDSAEPLLELVRSADPALASDAAGELCAVMPPRAKAQPPTGPFPGELATRLRALAAPDQPLLQRQRLLDCLRLLGTPADRALAQSIAIAAKKKGKS